MHKIWQVKRGNSAIKRTWLSLNCFTFTHLILAINPTQWYYVIHTLLFNVCKHGIQRQDFYKAIDQWTVWLQACVKAKGHHHFKWRCLKFSSTCCCKPALQSHLCYPTISFENHPKLKKMHAFCIHVGQSDCLFKNYWCRRTSQGYGN